MSPPRSPPRGILRTPPKPRTPRSSSLSPARDSGLRRAGDLVRDLDSLKTHMKEAVSDLNSWNRGSSPTCHERRAMHKTSEPVVRDPSAAAPLDGYLRETEPIEVSSPYPRVKISGNAPLIDKYADIMQVLKSTHKHQANLEQNFDAIQRARQESHMYGIIEEMAQDRSAAERMRIKQMVDDHIHSMNRHLEKDVMAELLKAEDRMKADFLIPERDTSMPKTKSKFNRNVQSRINTGLKKPLNGKVTNASGKENVPQKLRQKPSAVSAKTIRDMFSEEQKPSTKALPSSVPSHSQPAFIPKRSSHKEPYLRFRSSSPKSKTGSPVSVTRARAAAASPPPPPPMPTAILLSAPVIRGNSSPLPFTTSTPVLKTKPRSPSPKNSPRVEAPPQMSQPAEIERVGSPLIRKNSTLDDCEKGEESVYSDDFDESAVESAAPIDIPGYTAPKSTYHGPQFPPKKKTDTACSDEIAIEIRRKEVAENEAVNWIEQELMARMISEHLNQVKQISEAVPQPKQHHIQDDVSVEEEDMSKASGIDESLITDAVGQKGLQLFIDAGVPIDSEMVNALMKEVILEKIASTLGQLTSDNSDGSLPPGPVQPAARRRPSSPPALASVPSAPIRVDSPLVIVRGTPIPTPEVTPRHSPILPSSPVPQSRSHYAPAPPTPDLTPTPSVMEEILEARYKDDFEEPDEVSIPKSVKLPPDVDTIWDIASPPSHEVMTPARSLSPVSSSPPAVIDEMRTPSPSVESDAIIILPPPLPEPEPEAAVETEDRATSPQPWTEPDLNLLPPPCESVVEVTPPVQSSDDAQEIPQDEAPKRVATISESSSATSSAPSVISDTLNEPISEGQWMLSAYSEGELPHPPIENEIRNRIRHHLINDGLMHQQSVDDTLQDTDDIHHDQISSTDVSQSEGEILHRDPLPNIQSTLAAMAHAQSATIAAQSVEKSLGEVILPSTSHGEPKKTNGKKPHRILSAGELSEVPEEPTPSERGPSTSVTRSGRRHPTLGQVVSTSDEHRPLKRRSSPQASRTSLVLSQTFGYSDIATSQNSMRQTASDLDSATTDRLNIEAILQSRDYFNTTQSDLATTTDFQLRASDHRIAESAEYSMMDSEIESAGETLSPGLRTRPPLQVSVTIPSVMDEDSEISPEEISEISLL